MYVDVLVEIKSKLIDQTYTYEVPKDFQEKIKIGMVVKVLFGKQKLEGYVLNIKTAKPDFQTKPILEIKEEVPALNAELLKLGEFLKTETLCSLSTCYAAMLPKAIKAKNKAVVNKKYQTYLVLEKDKVKDNLTKAQQLVIKLFVNQDKVLKKEAQKISISAVQTLVKKEILKEVKEEIFRFNLENNKLDIKKKLTQEQEKAVTKIKSYFGIAKTILLHGVTGSGKTEVYMQLIAEILREDKTALVLVPEISLTPQLIQRFNARFPNIIAVLHSNLNDGERFDEWRKITSLKAKIVIGARSAVFAPLENIGIIIMDEEHADSYKQDNKPKYHALKVAEERSKNWKCPLVLGSATPSLNSMARALKKVYEYVPLTKRVTGFSLPQINLIDMNEEMKNRHPILSRDLECAIIERLNRNEQIVLLLNRRGHSTIINCSNCGFTYECPHCDITLTYHKASKQLRCHYCGYTKYIDKVCPKCAEDGLNYLGLGTEKLEEYIKDIFPTAKVVRMDADTTQNKGNYEMITKDFEEHKYDILLGTQMVSKGLDFPDVTLVGIINADASFQIPEYKSNERSYALIAQASGRAGRSSKKGVVYIQTYNPEHPILKCIKYHNYAQYFNYEMKIRKTLKYPPFYYLAQIKLKGRDYEKLSKEVKKAKAFLENKIDKESIILGPATSSPFYVNNSYSYEFLIKYRKKMQIIEVLKQLDDIYKIDRDIVLDIDISY